MGKVRELVLPAIEALGKIEAWIVYYTGFAKKGMHSVGVARQYCGRLGKTDNCQIAVTLSIANHAASLPIAYRLYLTEDWAADQARRKKAHVPDRDAIFKTKAQIALDQIRAALAAGVSPGVLLADNVVTALTARSCSWRHRHGFALRGWRAIDTERLAS